MNELRQLSISLRHCFHYICGQTVPTVDNVLTETSTTEDLDNVGIWKFVLLCSLLVTSEFKLLGWGLYSAQAVFPTPPLQVTWLTSTLRDVVYLVFLYKISMMILKTVSRELNIHELLYIKPSSTAHSRKVYQVKLKRILVVLHLIKSKCVPFYCMPRKPVRWIAAFKVHWNFLSQEF